MATIKGQNLRLAVAEQCVAKARTCTVHVAMQSESSSTKDDEGDWESNTIVGMSWDASCEAEVSTNYNKVSLHQAGTDIYRSDLIHMKKGEIIALIVDGATSSTKSALYDADGTKLGNIPYNVGLQYTATADMDIYFECNEPRTVSYMDVSETTAVTTETLFSYMESKQPGEVTFDYTGGNHNRETEKVILRGQAFITDMSIQAQNRQTAVCTIQLTGTGELEIVNE